MVVEMPGIPSIPEFISVPECDDSSSDDDAGFMPGRIRYFSGIAPLQNRSFPKEEVMLYGEDNGEDEDGDDRDLKLQVSPPHQTLREYLFQIMPPEWRKEIETPLDPNADKEKKGEEVKVVSPYPKGYETPEARLKLLQREVHALCHGNGYLNIDNFKPDSQDFVDGILDCSFEVAMGRCAMAEAKAAKRRAKRHRKREMEALRRCLDRKRRLEDYEDVIHYRDALQGGAGKMYNDAGSEGKGELKEEKAILNQMKEEAFGIDLSIKDHSDGSFCLSRKPCSAEELSAEQRELIMQVEGESSDEELIDTCPQD